MFHTGKAVYEEIHRPKCLYEINEQNEEKNKEGKKYLV